MGSKLPTCDIFSLKQLQANFKNATEKLPPLPNCIKNVARPEKIFKIVNSHELTESTFPIQIEPSAADRVLIRDIKFRYCAFLWRH
jgi:hypothetical protein